LVGTEPRGNADVKRYRRNLHGEVQSAALYRMLAAAESSPELAEVYRRLASVEERHAEVWRAKLREAGHEPPPIAPGGRVRLLGWLARRFGADTVLPLVLAGEASDIHAYDSQADARAATNRTPPTTTGCRPAPTAWRGIELGDLKKYSIRWPSAPVADLGWASPLPPGSDRGTISGGKLIPWASDDEGLTDRQAAWRQGQRGRAQDSRSSCPPADHC
jgi:hypothetical protein